MSEPKPTVYVLHGDDAHAMQQFVAGMYQKLGDPATADLNFTRLDGRSAGEDDLRTATGSMPFLADRRVVVLDHPLAREPEKKGKEAQEAHDRFVAGYLNRLDHLPETTALVLVVEDQRGRWDWEKLPRQHWLREWAEAAGKEKAYFREFDLPDDRDMPYWIEQQAKKAQGSFTRQAAMALAGQIGNDTQVASQEIYKLLTYVDFARPVDQEDVAALTGAIDRPDIFAMVDALGMGDGKEALRMLHLLMDEQDWNSVFGMIVRQFRLLLLVREIMDGGGGSDEAARELGGEPFRVSPYMATKLYRQAGRFSMDMLRGIYRRLLAMDEALKTSGADPAAAFDAFVAELADRG